MTQARPTSPPTPRGAAGGVWSCRLCQTTNDPGWRVCGACGRERPPRRAWMRARPLRLLAVLCGAVVGVALGVATLSAWGAVVGSAWVLPAVAAWVVLVGVAALIAGLRRRSAG